MNEIEHFEKHGYRRDREQRLREIAGGRDCLSLEAANQIRHLKAQNELLRSALGRVIEKLHQDDKKYAMRIYRKLLQEPKK